MGGWKYVIEWSYNKKLRHTRIRTELKKLILRVPGKPLKHWNMVYRDNMTKSSSKIYMYKIIIYIGNKRIRGVFKFQVALLAWKMWEEQPTAILLSSSRRWEILLLVKFGRMAWWQLLPYQSDQGNQPPGCPECLRVLDKCHSWFELELTVFQHQSISAGGKSSRTLAAPYATLNLVQFTIFSTAALQLSTKNAIHGATIPSWPTSPKLSSIIFRRRPPCMSMYVYSWCQGDINLFIQ